jgi:hypothetical protein
MGIKENVSSYQVLENDNYEIVLVEIAPSNDKMELHKRERFYIENNECANTRVPTRTQVESNLVNRERINEYIANFRKMNKDLIIQRSAEYYLIKRYKP